MKIAIIGAGISGLTLANLIYLGESNKINFKIFEKNSVLNNEETGIQLLPNATRILNLIGLNKIDSKSFFSPNSINFMDITNGKNISKIDLSNLTSDYSPYFCLKKSTLKKFLLKQLPENSVVFNKKITSISEKENFKIINFSDGSFYESDLVIAADGIFSQVREENFFTNKLSFTGSLAFRMIYNCKNNVFNFEKDSVNVFLGSSEHALFYPINKKNEYNIVSILNNKKFNVISKNFQIDKNRFSNIFNKEILNWNRDLRNIIENSKEISCWPILKIKKLSYWFKDNVVLLGDAAHAISPHQAQGAAQSIESAYELYKNLDENNLQNGLKLFEKNRKKTIHKIQIRSNINKNLFQVSNVFLKNLRNFTFKHLLKNKIFLKLYFDRLIYFKNISL